MEVELVKVYRIIMVMLQLALTADFFYNYVHCNYSGFSKTMDFRGSVGHKKMSIKDACVPT